MAVFVNAATSLSNGMFMSELTHVVRVVINKCLILFN